MCLFEMDGHSKIHLHLHFRSTKMKKIKIKIKILYNVTLTNGIVSLTIRHRVYEVYTIHSHVEICNIMITMCLNDCLLSDTKRIKLKKTEGI